MTTSQHSEPPVASAAVRWIDDVDSTSSGVTFGVPWPAGMCSPLGLRFECSDDAGRDIPIQSWTTARWPDDTIKWTAHAIAAQDTPSAITKGYRVRAVRVGSPTQTPAQTPARIKVTRDSTNGAVVVHTGKVAAVFGNAGDDIVLSSISTGIEGHAHLVARNGRLVLHTQPVSDVDAKCGSGPWKTYYSHVDQVSVEQDGPVKATVSVRGTHRLRAEPVQTRGETDQDTARQAPTLLPFSLRFYFYSGSEAIRLTHTLVYDDNPLVTCIRGIGVHFDVPLGTGSPLYDRHVRFSSATGGVLSEAIQGITGLWRDPGHDLRATQVAGRPLPGPQSPAWEPHLGERHRQWLPAWNDYCLHQMSPDGFTARKRTGHGHAWVNVPGGQRAAGTVYLGTAQHGGLAIGMRYFWERYPTSLAIENAAGDTGTIALWLYSPEAGPMDLRPYHDGLGQQTYSDQLDALSTTYEDWEPGLGSPRGIARTNEIMLYGLSATPTSTEFSYMSQRVQDPPVLVAHPAYIHQTAALGRCWVPINPPPPAANHGQDRPPHSIEERLAFFFSFYEKQVSQRRWYGFWDHGDIMHTYDSDRHTWRYDVGGYAWDNSELSPDLWLWLYFLCTGHKDVFRLAEAMTRHTGKVDVYHLPPWRGLGTRHGVQHWSDSCKQARIANAIYRRIFYYLSGGDDRVGELLRETLDAPLSFTALDPYRKVRKPPAHGEAPYVPDAHAAAISLGTDWSAMAAAWFVEWERHGPRWKEALCCLRTSMASIARLKNGFVTGMAFFDTHSGAISPPSEDADNIRGVVDVSHLSAVFGLVEICAELIDAFRVADPALAETFSHAWFDYCRYYNASVSEQAARYGVPFGRKILRQGHSRLTAYVAAQTGDAELAQRAWHEFRTGDGYPEASTQWSSHPVPSHSGLAEAEEAPWISTNLTAQYCLAGMHILAWAPMHGD